MSDIPENCTEPRRVKPIPETGSIRFIGEKEGHRRRVSQLNYLNPARNEVANNRNIDLLSQGGSAHQFCLSKILWLVPGC
jgi:hypothetical protein